MRIEYLADNQEYIQNVIGWLYNQWGHNYEYGKKVWTKRVNNRLNKEKIPTTFIAIENNTPVATASIIEYDMDTRKDLTPWMADVYVDPNWRGQEIATKLIKRILKEAKEIGVSKLYLYTREAEGLYKKLGWKGIERIDYYGDNVPIMVYKIS